MRCHFTLPRSLTSLSSCCPLHCPLLQFQNSRLYLVTRNPEPYLPPDARSLVAATNFTVTRSGLEGQLLGLTIQKEQPELEAQKSGLLKQEEDLKVWSVGCGREGGPGKKEEVLLFLTRSVHTLVRRWLWQTLRRTSWRPSPAVQVWIGSLGNVID